MISEFESSRRSGRYGALFLELLLIFIGVSAAFAVESYREGQAEGDSQTNFPSIINLGIGTD